VLAEKLPPKPACGRDYSHAMEALLAYIYCKTYPLHRVCLMGAAPVFLAAQVECDHRWRVFGSQP